MEKRTDMDRERRIAWLRDAKYGLFIHWGVYSRLAGEWNGKLINRIGEQIMRFCEISIPDYETVPPLFNPRRFNAEEWVRLAVAAGMRYIVITAKHHDGFAMYHSKCSPYNIVDKTPFGRDPMKELAAACAKHQVKLCFYYSHFQDWHHPDGGIKDPWAGMTTEGRHFERYMREKAVPQVTELLTEYGPIGIMWYDTPMTISKEHAQEFADLVHALQPACVVSSRVGHDLGDYRGFRDNQIPFNTDADVWETCATINDTWGYRKNDQNWKPASLLLRQLISIVSKGGNFLLNVGPDGEGLIPAESVERLLRVGQWLSRNAEAIYGAAGNVVPYEPEWGVFTARPGKIYAHLFDPPSDGLAIAGIRNTVTGVYRLSDPARAPVAYVEEYDAASDYPVLRIDLGGLDRSEEVPVIVIEIDGGADIDGTLSQRPDGSLVLDGHRAELLKGSPDSPLSLSPNGIVENWTRPEDALLWRFKVVCPGDFSVTLQTLTEKRSDDETIGAWEGGHRLAIKAPGRSTPFTVTRDSIGSARDLSYWHVVSTRCGSITFPGPGMYEIRLTAEELCLERGLGPKVKALRLEHRCPRD